MVVILNKNFLLINGENYKMLSWNVMLDLHLAGPAGLLILDLRPAGPAGLTIVFPNVHAILCHRM